MIAAIFLAVSLLSSPIPGLNEPHYLCKARSFSDPGWCHRDFFLASADAHYCFFWLFGPLTQVLPFEMTALAGRCISAFVLAAGWAVAGRAIGLSSSSGILSAGAFAFLTQLGSFSGEWLLAGFESKVAAWGFGLAAIGFWIRGTVTICPGMMTVAGIFCGASAMLHPVVGGWIAVCICIVWLFDWAVSRRSARSTGGIKSIIGIVAFSTTTIVAALPGLIPALKMVMDDSLSKEDRELASFIQVFWRLKHHLDPTELTPSQWIYAMNLLSVTIVAFIFAQQHLRRVSRSTTTDGRRDGLPMSGAESALLLKFLLASLFVATVGVAIGWHVVEARDMEGWQWRAALMKFYPFRTFDAMLPIVAGMFVALVLQQRMIHASKKTALIVLLLFGGLPVILAEMQQESCPPGYSGDQFQDWQAACSWIRRETPPAALFLTPRESFAFKWFAERAEYVCYKDCPQDAAGILEWNQRLWWLHDWTLKSSTDGVYDRSDLKELRNQTGCDYIVTRILGPFETAPIWQGKHWQVIQVP